MRRGLVAAEAGDELEVRMSIGSAITGEKRTVAVFRIYEKMLRRLFSWIELYFKL